MNYFEFHKQWHELDCFSIQQIYAWHPDFNRSNITEWVKKGYIVKLRNSWYAFRESMTKPDFSLYIANRIYRPSYISLHFALSYYGMIPEAIMKITSVTTLKTAEFRNDFGMYTYQSVKPKLMFGYDLKPVDETRSLFFATPEKALLDLLYLYPFYKTTEDMLDLRLDDDYMHECFEKQRFIQFAEIINSSALNERIETLFKTYEI